MTQPHEPDTSHYGDHPTSPRDELVDPPPPVAVAEAETRERRPPRLSIHPRPHLRRLGRGALAALAIAAMVLLTGLTLRYSRQSLEAVAAGTPSSPVAPRPLALRRIEEMRARLPAPPSPPERTLLEPTPAPPPAPPRPAPRERSDHRAAWRAPLTHRASARTAARASSAAPSAADRSATDDSLPPDLSASLRNLAAGPLFAGASPPTAPPRPPGAGARSAAVPAGELPPPPNLLAAPSATTIRWVRPANPQSPYLLRAGTLLPAVLAQRVVSDQPGLVRAVVARDVRDSLAGAHVLVPRGTVLLGRQGSLPGFGQDRLAVIWTRLLFPDGRGLALGAGEGSPAASASRDGTAGLAGRVRHHWGRRYAAAALLSLVGAGVQLSQPQSGSLLEPSGPGAEAAGALGRELGRTSAEILRRYADLPPTIELSPGARVHAVLVDDLVFASPYQPLHR